VKLIRLMTTVAGIGLLTTSCYSLQPSAAVVPAPGTRLAFAINDVGRVALGGSMGPELRQVEGNLQAKDGDDYVVSVRGVELLQGGYQSWAGETVRINSSYVSAVYEKKFSAGKTAVAVGAAALAASLLVSKDFRSFVDLRGDQEDGTVATRRGRIPRFSSPSMRPGLPPFLRSLNPPRSH
jgi:hypothetical protein